MSIRLRARVNEVINPPANFLTTVVDGESVPVTKLPNPDWLEISEEDGAFFLYYLSSSLECFADTWHDTIEGAQREALLGFNITPDQWSRIGPLQNIIRRSAV